MHSVFSIRRGAAAVFAIAALIAFSATAAFATKKMVLGPVAFELPDDFNMTPGSPPTLHENASGITLEVSELPPQALEEFRGPPFLEFLASVGYTNATYAAEALKRTDAHTYVLADAKGKEGPESRFLLVLAGSGRAAIVTAYAPKSEFERGHASRAAIETILSHASVVSGAANR
jgi:hypothetical protein